MFDWESLEQGRLAKENTVKQDVVDGRGANFDRTGGDNAMTKVFKRVDDHMRSPIFAKLAIICPILLDEGSREILRSVLFKWAREGKYGYQQVVDARWTRTFGKDVLRVAWQTRMALGAGLAGSVGVAATATLGTCDGTAAGVVGSIWQMKDQRGGGTDPITMKPEKFHGETLQDEILTPQRFGAGTWGQVEWIKVITWMEEYQRVTDPSSKYYGFPGYFVIKGGGRFELEPVIKVVGGKEMTMFVPVWHANPNAGTGHAAFVTVMNENVVNPAWLDEAGCFRILVYDRQALNPETNELGVWKDLKEMGTQSNIEFAEETVIITNAEHRALDITFPDQAKTAEAYAWDNAMRRATALLGHVGAMNIANVFNRLGAAMARIPVALFSYTKPEYRMGSFSAVKEAILEKHKKLRTYELDIHIAKDLTLNAQGNLAHPNELLYDRRGWTAELRRVPFDLDPVKVEWNVDGGFTVSVPADGRYKRAGVHTYTLAEEAFRDQGSYKEAYKKALEKLLDLLHDVFVDQTIPFLVADIPTDESTVGRLRHNRG